MGGGFRVCLPFGEAEVSLDHHHPVPEIVPGQAGEEGDPVVGLAEGLFVLDALGDLGHGVDHFYDRPPVVVDRVAGDEIGAVQGLDHHLDRAPTVSPLHQPDEGAAVGGGSGVVKDIVAAVAPQRCEVETERVERRPVRREDRLVRSKDQNRVADRLEDPLPLPGEAAELLLQDDVMGDLDELDGDLHGSEPEGRDLV